jgi:hypothetical protein
MNENSYVVVFPSIFSENKIPLLVENIKKILNIKNEKFSLIKKDESVIIVKANDPVFASSAINLLFGIKRVAIAKQINNNFEEIISTITEIGSNLLLRGDKFLVKVEGTSKGFLPKDLEIAATSSIIEKAVKINAKPGTIEDYDKLLYTFLTKLKAYVCIFSDTGLGGIPYNYQKKRILCCVFDELSAVSCLETIKQGFETKIIICYKKISEVTNLVKMLNHIIPRMVSSSIELEFFKTNLDIKKDYQGFLKMIIHLSNHIAKKSKITHVSLPITPLIHPLEFIDECVLDTYSQKLVPMLVLGGLNDNIFQNAKEIGLEKYLGRIEKLVKTKNKDSKLSNTEIKSISNSISNLGQKITIQIGPNNVHDILDSLQLNNDDDAAKNLKTRR